MSLHTGRHIPNRPTLQFFVFGSFHELSDVWPIARAILVEAIVAAHPLSPVLLPILVELFLENRPGTMPFA